MSTGSSPTKRTKSSSFSRRRRGRPNPSGRRSLLDSKTSCHTSSRTSSCELSSPLQKKKKLVLTSSLPQLPRTSLVARADARRVESRARHRRRGRPRQEQEGQRAPYRQQDPAGSSSLAGDQGRPTFSKLSTLRVITRRSPRSFRPPRRMPGTWSRGWLARRRRLRISRRSSRSA